MNVLSITGINPAKAEQVIKELNQLLADFQVYYTNLRGYHWHVRGRQFYTFHSQFEKMYNEAAEQVDEIAERILQLGGVPENRFREYLKLSKIKEETKVTDPAKIIPALLDSLKVLIAQERAVAAAADAAEDIVTGDLVSDLLDGQEKSVWMISALEA